MQKTLNKEFSEIKQFYQSNHSLSLEIMKTAAFVEHLSYILKRLNIIFNSYQTSTKKDLSSAIISNMLIELQALKSTNKELNSHLEMIRKQQGILTQTSGRIIQLRKQIDKAISQANTILSHA